MLSLGKEERNRLKLCKQCHYCKCNALKCLNEIKSIFAGMEYFTIHFKVLCHFSCDILVKSASNLKMTINITFKTKITLTCGHFTRLLTNCFVLNGEILMHQLSNSST